MWAITWLDVYKNFLKGRKWSQAVGTLMSAGGEGSDKQPALKKTRWGYSCYTLTTSSGGL